MSTLSVVITTWNEEKNLARAVSSVKKIADEIVVVDTESTDQTVTIAKKLGCKVYHHKNTSIVEPVRNFSISKARGDWILLLDADEEIPQLLAEEIKKIIANDQFDYYRIPRKNIIFGKWIKSSHWWPDYVYRLFKKGSVTWSDEVHSIPYTKGKGADLSLGEEVSIIHHNYDSIDQYLEKLNRYTSNNAKNLLDSGYNFYWLDVIVKPFDEFVRQYFSRRGYVEGLHGLVLAGLQAFSEFVLYIKLWQASDFVPVDVTIDKLSEELKSKNKEYEWWFYEAKINESNFLTKIFWKIKRKLKI